jgi:transposase-like protein
MAGAERMTIEEVVRRVLREEHGDVIRDAVRVVAQELMEVEVSELIGAERGERSEDRATHRNGYRPRRWDTRAGEIELQIPKIRQGSYFPSFLQPRKRSEQALVSVVQQAYVCGVSTRRVDQLVESLGLRISKSEVSRIAGLLDEQVQAFRERPLEGRYPYLFVDAKVEKVRAGGRVVRKCVVIAHGVHESGRREIIGLDVGEAETEAFWREFLRSLVARGLVGVQLAISDAHPGLKTALAQVLNTAWQRCTVHFLRDCLGHARKDQHGLLGALIRPIFQAASGDEARARLGEAVAQLVGRLPKIAGLLEEAEDDVLAFYAMPGRALAQAALHQPAGTLQPRDRPPHRRRRHLPRRPLADPAGLDARDRGQRRVARRALLHEPPVDGAPRRPTDRLNSLSQDHQQGGRPARRGLSSHPFTDEVSAELLHHVPGLDFVREPGSGHSPATLKPASLDPAAEPVGEDPRAIAVITRCGPGHRTVSAGRHGAGARGGHRHLFARQARRAGGLGAGHCTSLLLPSDVVCRLQAWISKANRRSTLTCASGQLIDR